MREYVSELLQSIEQAQPILKGRTYYYDPKKEECKGITDESPVWLYIQRDEGKKRDEVQYNLSGEYQYERTKYKLIARLEGANCLETAVRVLSAQLTDDCYPGCAILRSSSICSEHIYKTETGQDLKKELSLIRICFELETLLDVNTCCNQKICLTGGC